MDVSLVTRALLVSGSVLPKCHQITALWIPPKLGVTPRHTPAYVRHTLGDSVTGRVIWPSSNSRRVAARPTTPRRRSGVLHGSGAVLLSASGNVRLLRRPNCPLVSGPVWSVDASSSPARLRSGTSALGIPKWFTIRRRLQTGLVCAQNPLPWWLQFRPLFPLPPSLPLRPLPRSSPWLGPHTLGPHLR